MKVFLRSRTYTQVMQAPVSDPQGKVLLSAWGVWSHVASAEEVEALACLEGIRLTVE
jgi:hypothetical protein